MNKILFKRHTNGTVGSWQILVYAAEATIVRIARKVIGGKPVETRTVITEGKNIGRANETTPYEQAVSEAESKYNKKLDEGYVKTIEEAQVKATNSLGFAKPMLATSIEKVKKWDFPIYGSAKLDGHRMLATVVDGLVVLYSRQGKPVCLEHIREVLQKAYDKGYWSGHTLDGEVYKHGETLQRISSLVKKPKPESIGLVYYVYDAIGIEGDGYLLNPRYKGRLHYISTLAKYIQDDLTMPWEGGVLPNVVYLRQHAIHNQEDLDAYHAKNLSEGYEGTMVRHGDTGYEEGKRSQSLMKKKDFQDAEFEIICAFEGKPNLRHSLKVGMYKCRTSAGKDFDVLAPGDMHEKNTHAVNGADSVGKYMTVKYFNMTPDGVPFLPVALRVREDI